MRLVVFDVDGVLTDGSLFIGARGEELKVFHSRDGHGMKLLQASGVAIGVISGRSSPVVETRMHALGIEHVFQGQRDKVPAFDTLLARLELTPTAAAYVGDDVMDLPVMRRAGFAIAVADAHPLVAAHAHWRTPNPGGRGAARDVCEFIMRAQGNLERAFHEYLGSPDEEPRSPNSGANRPHRP